MRSRSEEYDYIFVGSGVATAMVLSKVLEAKPKSSILILEAGKRIPARDRASWWEILLKGGRPYSWTYDVDDPDSPDCESATIGSTKWGFRESRVRAYGGSTMHWGGWSVRFKEEDFFCRTNTGRGADWPIEYGDLEGWYSLAEQELGVGGDASDLGPYRSGGYALPPFPWSMNERALAEAMEKHGLEPGYMPIARYSRCMTTGTCKYCPIGSRYIAQDHLDALLASSAAKYVHLRVGATVTRLLEDRNRVIGVEYFDQFEEEERSVHADTVIVCAGAYETTKLLLASRSADWPEGLGNKHDQVGRYLVTHTMLRVSGQLKTNKEKLYQEYDFPTLMSRSWDTPERQREGKVFLFNNRSRPKIDFAGEMHKGKTRAEIEKIATGPATVELHAFIEEFGDFENKLSLGNGDGQFNLPKTVVRFSRSSDVVGTANRVMKDMGEILKTRGCEGIDPDIYNPRGDHTSGTCRMGTRPDNSVTNKDLGVHGVDNLYLCTNAVFPSASAVNPTLTLAALALRLGDYLGGVHHD